MDFYRWHTLLTGSCELGKKAFAESRGIDLEKDMFSVGEFIGLAENAYGAEIIKKLKNH